MEGRRQTPRPFSSGPIFPWATPLELKMSQPTGNTEKQTNANEK